MSDTFNRRDWIMSATAVVGSAALPLTSASAAPASNVAEPFGYSLNTSTIREQRIPVDREAEIAAKAGYNAFEPWLRELDEYAKKGGSLKDLGKKIADLGLKVESSIGFAEWIVDDDAKRKKGLETAKRDMEMVLAIGGKRMAAPPMGATNEKIANLYTIADRYRTLAELGRQVGIIPEVELWGFSKTLSRLGETVFVAMESAHPDACILPDIYHLYKGHSEFDSIRLLNAKAIGNAPLKQTLRTLRDIGYRGMLSLELFNPEYWKQDAMLVAKTGLAKMKDVVQASLADS